MGQLQFRGDDSVRWLDGFGDGSDGNLTISGNTTEAPIDASCTGTAGDYTLSATNASFATGQIIMIHKTRGNTTTSCGTWEINKITGYSAGTINLKYALQNSYQDSGSDQSQVRVLKQYNNVTINSGVSYTAKAWDGNVGGIIGWFAKGTTTINGSVTGAGKGFRGGNGATSQGQASSGEGTAGASVAQRSANGNAGGGGQGDDVQGGAGSNGGSGTTAYTRGNYGLVGNTSGTASLVTMVFGGAGGGGSEYGSSPAGPIGANGGSIIFIVTNDLIVNNTTGSLVVTGNTGTTGDNVGSGSGAGGSILLKVKTATLNTTRVTSTGGSAVASWSGNTGAAGGVGRIHLDYKTSYTGTTNPTLDATQDSSLDYAPSSNFFMFFN